MRNSFQLANCNFIDFLFAPNSDSEVAPTYKSKDYNEIIMRVKSKLEVCMRNKILYLQFVDWVPV